MDCVGNRISIKHKNPNPLFVEWLTDWRDKAIEKDSKMQYCFSKALEALKKYPLPLETGRDCKILQGFGDKLCQMLDEKLAKHKNNLNTKVYGDTNQLNTDIQVHTNDYKARSFSNPGSSSNIAGCSSNSNGFSSNIGGFSSNLAGYSNTNVLSLNNRSSSSNKSTSPEKSSMSPRKIGTSPNDKATSPNNKATTLNNKVTSPNKKDSSLNNIASSKRSSTGKVYIPSYRSGPYAILLAIYTESLKPTFQGFLLKTEVSKVGQKFCDKSFTKPDPGSYYTAWSSMKTLLDKGLVIKKSVPAKFSLSESGIELARKLYENNTDGDIIKDINIMDRNTDDKDNYTNKNHRSGERDGNNKIDKNKNKAKNKNRDKSNTETYTKNTESNTKNTETTYASFDTEAHGLDSNLQNIFNSKPDDIINIDDDEDDLNNSILARPTKPSKRKKTNENDKTNKKQKNNEDSNDLESGGSSGNIKVNKLYESFVMAPGKFRIILLVDSHEVSGKKMSDDDPLIRALKNRKVDCEVRNLKIGDFAWICRDYQSHKELVLPYIIERKRMDDFASSIKDGRFHEQKFRLKQSGIQNLIYLVEKFGDDEHLGMPSSSIYQAATNTAIQDKFCVKYTDGLKGTVQYISCLHSILVRLFKDKALMSCPKADITKVSIEDSLVPLMVFEEFNKSASKTKDWTIKDMFIRQLLQLKGLSFDKATAIVEKYPTPISLYTAYQNCSSSEGEKLLSNLKFGLLKKNLGPAISKTLHQLFTMKKYP